MEMLKKEITWDTVRTELLKRIKEVFDVSYLCNERYTNLFPPTPPTPKYAIGKTVKICWNRNDYHVSPRTWENVMYNVSPEGWYDYPKKYVTGKVFRHEKDEADWAVKFYCVQVTDDGPLKGKQKRLLAPRLHEADDGYFSS